MKIVIVGGGGHGRVIVDIVEKTGSFELVGLLDSEIPCGQHVLGYEVIGRDADLPRLVHQRGVEGAIVAVGDNWQRAQVVKRLRYHTAGIRFPAAIHPSAQFAKDTRVGEGTVVMAGCVINTGATAGEFCILNSNCSIDHDCQLGDYVSFAPNSCAGGNVRVGNYTAISLGANIIHGISIDAHTVVGAGATVLRDLPSQVVAYGTPARVVRNRTNGEPYL